MRLARKLYIFYTLSLLLLSLIYLIPPDIVFNQIERHILIQLKVPVLLTAWLVGAAICSASASLQVLLRNPLADPGIIGITSGASLMAAAVLLLSGSVLSLSFIPVLDIYLLPIACFTGAFVSALLIFYMARWMGGSVSSVILAGIAISTLCSALVGWMFLVAPPNSLQNLTFWLMGSLNNSNYTTLSISAILIVFALVFLIRIGPSLNRLYLGEQNAILSGVNTRTLQTRVIILVSILVGVSVSVAGSIAFLGLLVPHFVRRIHGNNNQIVMPISALIGASVMVLCAIFNTHFSSVSLPISMLTASIGAPLFIYIMLKRRSFA
uniref:FecCD family ABC transporter permease n=1 Tax=Ningiella ruwaisensis TaxID=2364274 RepID=UPI0010A05B64|nr:iron ABC transporter permease [Ningiella ruwaisensis]